MSSRPLPPTTPGIRPVVLDVTLAASIDCAREQIGAQTAGYTGWTCW
jgi:hypothetical protein